MGVIREMSACAKNCLLPLQECKRLENYAHNWTEMEIVLREISEECRIHPLGDVTGRRSLKHTFQKSVVFTLSGMLEEKGDHSKRDHRGVWGSFIVTC